MTDTSFHNCKCGADDIDEHIVRVETGQIAGHVFTGPVAWNHGDADAAVHVEQR